MLHCTKLHKLWCRIPRQFFAHNQRTPLPGQEHCHPGHGHSLKMVRMGLEIMGTMRMKTMFESGVLISRMCPLFFEIMIEDCQDIRISAGILWSELNRDNDETRKELGYGWVLRQGLDEDQRMIWPLDQCQCAWRSSATYTCDMGAAIMINVKLSEDVIHLIAYRIISDVDNDIHN